MSDIRKRIGKKGTTYQVRYPSTKTKSGYAYATFDTMKEARAFVESGRAAQLSQATQYKIKTVPAAIQRWLDICEKEGRQGKDPVTPAVLQNYRRRARIMSEYDWDKPLQELQAPDIVQFRSWLLQNYSRDQAKTVLSSFHSALLEMQTQGVIIADPASGISIHESRYKELTCPRVFGPGIT